MNYPRAFSQIGLSVPNLEQAVEFYREVMGWYVVIQPSVMKEENSFAIGIELFEFANNDKKNNHLNLRILDFFISRYKIQILRV